MSIDLRQCSWSRVSRPRFRLARFNNPGSRRFGRYRGKNRHGRMGSKSTRMTHIGHPDCSQFAPATSSLFIRRGAGRMLAPLDPPHRAGVVSLRADRSMATALASRTRSPARPSGFRGFFFAVPNASNHLLTGCCYQSTFLGWSMSPAKAQNLVMLPSTAPDKVRRVDKICTDWLAGCPSCGEPLRFARTVLQIGDLSELHTFGKRCFQATSLMSCAAG